MEPKEKAKELVNKFMTFGAADFAAKECALICVEEVLKPLKKCNSNIITYQVNWEMNFYLDVKQEINKL